MDFVNIHGTPVDVSPDNRPVSTRSRIVDDKPMHLGFAVTGFSAKMIGRARIEHEEQQAHLVRTKKQDAANPFNEEVYMRLHKGKKINSRNYSTRAAADACAELAKKTGWLSVNVTEVTKNVKDK